MIATPARPPVFSHELAPVGVEVKFFSAWQDRPMLDSPARIAAVHTNAASGEGDVDSASSWTERNRLPGSIHGNPVGKAYYTIPHYQVDRDGRARKILPTDRRGICNSTVLPGTSQWAGLTQAQRLEVNRHPVNVSRFSLGIETADTGTAADPTISAFTDIQAERVAEILAYEHLVPGNDIVLDTPTAWFTSGVGSHTDPFPYPFWTTVRGKPCPGAKKKAQLPAIVARAAVIVEAWTAPDPTPPHPTEEDDMLFLVRAESNPNLIVVANGIESRRIRAVNIDELVADLIGPTWGIQYHDPTKPGRPEITSVKAIPTVSDDELVRLGYEIDESAPG